MLRRCTCIMTENDIRRAIGLPPIKESRRKEPDDIITGPLPKQRHTTKESYRHSKPKPQKPLKETMLYQGAKLLIKQIRKNHIPKKHDDVIKMLNDLERQEKERRETEQAKIRIKELQRINKEREKQKRLARRAKLKKFLRIG